MEEDGIESEIAGIQKTAKGVSPHAERGCSQIPVTARTMDCLPALSPSHSNGIKTACVVGKINNCDTQILLDSEASCLVMQADHTLLADLVKSC